MEHHCDVTISAQTGSKVSAPVLSNLSVKGNINITTYLTDSTVEVPDTKTLITEYKKSILCEYAYLTEPTSRAGEQVLLNDRYVDPMIVQRHEERNEKEQEMRSRGEKFFNFRSNQRNKNISLDRLFSSETEAHKNMPRAVILQGDSGSGKSITAQKIFLDWASGEHYVELFDSMFYLRCQEINNLSGEISLLEILDCSLAPSEIAEILKYTPQRILFIVDGFDELILSAALESIPSKPDIKANPSTILCSLLKGRMMRDSCLLVTTRSVAVDQLQGILKKPQTFMEILGFSEKGVLEYFQKFFEDKEFLKKVYEQVKLHEMLYTVCFIPVFCWIICTIFKKKGKDGVRTKDLTTTTSIFVDFMFTILKHHSSLDRDIEQDLLKSLGQLAENGTPKRQILFHRKSLPKAISHIPNIPFLCTFRQQERTFLKEMFGFMHLSFQEFFCALSYLLTDKSQAKIKVKELLESAGNGRYNDHLLPVIRFLFGLSNKKVSRLFVGEQQRSTSAVIRAQLEKWISRVLVKNIMDTFYMSDFILHCLYELHDRDVLKNVMKLWEGSGIHIHWTLKGIDCQVFMYCLQYCTHISRMELKCSAENLKALHSAIYKCNTLWLDLNFMSDTDVDLLISALGRKKKIYNLKIEDGDLSDESLQKILKTLNEQQSVGIIHLSLRTVTYANADITMNFLIKEMMGKEFRICIASQAEESLCFEFTMESQNNSFRLTVGHTEEDQDKMLGKHSPHYYKAFSKISFAFSDPSTISVVDWKDFLKICHNLRRFSDVKDAEFDKNVDLLLSYLSSVPGLVEVDVRTKHLTDIWTSKILSFFHVNPKIPQIIFHLSKLILSDVERVCLTFSVTRKPFVPYKMHDSEGSNPSLVLSMDRWAYDENHISAGLSGSLPCDNPAFVMLNLSVPPLQGSRVTWEELFKRIYKLIQLTEKSSDLDESVDSLLEFLCSVPGLKEIKLWLNNLNEVWAAGLTALFMSCSSLLHLQLKSSMHRADAVSLGMVRQDGIRLSVGCNHVNYIDGFDNSLFETPVHKVLDCITIKVAEESENKTTEWKRFFHSYNQLKVFTEYCSKYEECVADVLSVLSSLSGLKDLDLVVRFMTIVGASRVLELLQTNSSLSTVNFLAVRLPIIETAFKGAYGNKIFRVQRTNNSDDDSDSDSFGDETAGQEDSDDESLSSCLSDISDDIRDCDETGSTEDLCSSEILSSELRAHKMISDSSNGSKKWRVVLKSIASDLNTKSPLTYMTLTLCETSEETNTDWRSFLWAYNQCKGAYTMSSRFDECIDALLLSLYSLPGLIQLYISTESLTENWAPKIFSLCYAYYSLHNICLRVDDDRRESDLNVCSSLNITKNIKESMVTVDIHAAHKTTRTIPSFISFTLPCSTVLKVDGRELLETFDLLKSTEENCEEQEEYVGSLMSILLSVPGLQKVAFDIGSLTENWVRRILSLAEVCSDLQEIRCNCKESSGLVLEEPLEILKKSQMDSDCMISITGMKLGKGSDEGNNIPILTSSTSSCTEKVKLTFCKNKFHIS